MSPNKLIVPYLHRVCRHLLWPPLPCPRSAGADRPYSQPRGGAALPRQSHAGAGCASGAARTRRPGCTGKGSAAGTSAACTGSVQCDFCHCVDRDSALCVISDNSPVVSSTKAFCMRFTERSVCSKPILSYRAVARVSIEFAMQIPKIRGHVPRSAAKKPRKDGVRFLYFWREKVSV